MSRKIIAILLLTACGLALGVLTSCAKQEKRKTTVIEVHRESEVVEEQPGEMIVE
ncbi:MAG: hypothetical protein ABIG44_11995 [Planctomycetota bacterium]